MESGDQQGLDITARSIGIHIFDNFDGDAAGLLPAFVSSHAVGHNRQPAPLLELLLAGGLPVSIAVFIVLALAAHITEARQLNSRPNPHDTSCVSVSPSGMGIIPNREGAAIALVRHIARFGLIERFW